MPFPHGLGEGVDGGPSATMTGCGFGASMSTVLSGRALSEPYWASGRSPRDVRAVRSPDSIRLIQDGFVPAANQAVKANVSTGKSWMADQKSAMTQRK